MKRIFVLLIMLMFMGGLFLIPENQDWNEYDGVDVQGIPILAEDWIEGDSVSVDLNFMPIVPTISTSERILDLYPTYQDWDISLHTGELQTLSNLFGDDTDYYTFRSYAIEMDRSNNYYEYEGKFLFTFECKYTDANTLYYSTIFDIAGSNPAKAGEIKTRASITNYYEEDTDVIYAETTWNDPNGDNKEKEGSMSISQNHFSNGMASVLISSSVTYNHTTYMLYYTMFDQLKITFNNITDSLYPSEYRIKDDNTYEHRMFIECPEYRTEIAITIPTGLTFDRTIPNVDTRESGGILYLENNTLPVIYTIFFTEDYYPDGSLSDDSILSFSETLADDTLFYPDAFYNDTEELANAGVAEPGTSGSYTDTHALDTTYYRGNGYNTLHYVVIDFTAPSNIEGLKYAVNTHTVAGAVSNLSIYNYDTAGWVKLADIVQTSGGWENGTSYNPSYWDSNTIRLNCSSYKAGSNGYIYIDYAEITFYIMTLADSDHYAESFADVSDWTASGSSTVATDGDVMTHDAAANERADSDGPSFASMVGLYVEFRIKANVSVPVTFFGAHADGITGGWAFQQGLGTITTSWVTKKFYVPSLTSYDAGALESIRFAPSSAAKVYFDYLRIGNSTSMGWQHDGSTTEAYTNDGDGDKTYTDSSDGDILTFGVDHSAGTGSSYSKVSPDTTSTSTRIERDYYPFIEARYNLTVCTIGDDGISINWMSDDRRTTLDTDSTYTNNTWVTRRYNVKIGSAASSANYGFYVYANGDTIDYTIEVDYIKLYSIANFTYSDYGCAVDEVAYVESGVLKMDSDTEMVFGHDPVLSVATTTYNVFNLTATNVASLRFDHYVSGWQNGAYGVTRSALTSGTMTDFKFRVGNGASGMIAISAIKFWKDATAPVIEDKYVSPTDGYDDEDITITAMTSDTIDAYSAYINADVYPVGFADSDYDMTEQVNTHWDYTFSTMTAGEYIFTIYASDGANTGTDTIAFTIRERIFEVVDYTYDYNDDTIVVKGTPNMDGSYTLYHNDSSVDTGSFEENTIFLVEWTRDTTAGLHKMGLYCYNGSDYQWVNGSYYIASEDDLSLSVVTSNIGYQVTAYIETNWGNTTITIYENDVQKDTDNEGNTLSYDKSQVEGNYSVGVKVDGTADLIWYNFTYEVLKDDLSITALNYDTTEDDVNIFVNTNWGNTTITIYEDDVQQTTDSEGALSYTKSTTAGDYDVGVKVDGTADLIWANFTYSIDTEDSLSITSLSFGSDGADITAFATTNWMNTTLTLYEDDVQQDTGSEGTTLSYTKATTAGDYSVAIKIDGTADSIWANYTYTINAEDDLYLTAISFDSSGINVTAFVNTNWGNCTITIYENNVEKDSGNEGGLSYVKATTTGNYDVAIKIDGTADLIWANYTYYAVSDEIEIIVYTLFGAGSDFDYMQYSFYITHDCTFIIEEWSDSWAKNETHSGSVSKGDRNIAWDKIGVDDIDANYTITFTSGALTKVIDGGYITAYKVLSITEIDFINIEQSDSWTTNLTINFNANKAVDWYIYDRDDSDAVLESGSATEGDGFMTWVQNTARGAHNFAVKWTDGISNEWYNGSYWVYDKNIDELPGGGDPGVDQRRTIEFWATVAGIISVIGLLVVGGVYVGLKDEMKQLQLPHYETQDERRGRRKR